MQPKEYQQRALETVRGYLDRLAEWKRKADANPDLEIDFASKAWEKALVPRPYVARKNGLGRPLPCFCLKIPTGGGKTFLAVKVIDFVQMIYRQRRTGLVLWIVPTTQIYRQTIRGLKDRDHPYRQHLDMASGGRTMIVEKTDTFCPQDVNENLVVLMLMLPSANRRTKDVLRIFKDAGGFQDFFPPEDDVQGQKAVLASLPNLDTYEKADGFWGRQIKTSLGNTLRMLSPVIILDEGHKAYSAGAQETLRGFNPSMIVELSATPLPGSNTLVDITGRELHDEQMIKLDLHVVNKASPDWKDTLLAGVAKRNLLEEKAREHEARTGTYIRPICLIQVERTGKDQQEGKWIHSEQVREHLNKILGIPPEEVAVKTSEKDELKEADDTVGLMSRECRINYVITKQALQEGWDCAFAYVLVILTNPTAQNSLTQLVGRILRQPYARKTHVPDLDESYVFCFQQRAGTLLESIRRGFEGEGLGDLRGHLSTDGASPKEETVLYEVRDCFRDAAERTILPVFVVRDGSDWRPVHYHTDIESRIRWDNVDLAPLYATTLSAYEEKDIEHVATLADNAREVIREREVRQLREGGVHVDPVFMSRQLLDIVPNPWQAHAFAESVLSHFQQRVDAKRLADNFVFIIEELRKCLESEKDRLAEGVFKSMLATGRLRFLVIGNSFDWRFPTSVAIRASSRRLNRKDNSPLQLSLYEAVPEDDFDEPEKAVAWYLEDQERLYFWFRNRPRSDYAIQGWRRHRIYPDFIFTVFSASERRDYERVYVLETKGLHLMGNTKTEYVQKVFDICTSEAQSRAWSDFAPSMQGKVLRFDVVSEQEWEAKLNELLQT